MDGGTHSDHGGSPEYLFLRGSDEVERSGTSPRKDYTSCEQVEFIIIPHSIHLLIFAVTWSIMVWKSRRHCSTQQASPTQYPVLSCMTSSSIWKEQMLASNTGTQ